MAGSFPGTPNPGYHSDVDHIRDRAYGVVILAGNKTCLARLRGNPGWNANGEQPMKGDRTSPYKEDDVLATLRGIRSTDPRFAWITREFGEEPDRRRDIATVIEDQFADETDGHLQLASLLTHLEAMIADMRTLNPVQELFDIVVPCVPDPRRLSVLLRRMGWSGEYWYTEYEATFALGTSIHGVRNERAKLVRALRRGPVWVPVLHRCAALVQELAPITQAQFKAACGIDLEGKDAMTLWGFLNALDLFDVDHWFHLEYANREPILHCDVRVDFGYARHYLDDLVVAAERRIAREVARQRKERNRERLERRRFEDPWEVRPSRQSRHTDVGVRDASPILWRDIPDNCALRAEPGYDALQYGAPLVMSRTLVVREQLGTPEDESFS